MIRLPLVLVAALLSACPVADGDGDGEGEGESAGEGEGDDDPTTRFDCVGTVVCADASTHVEDTGDTCADSRASAVAQTQNLCPPAQSVECEGATLAESCAVECVDSGVSCVP